METKNVLKILIITDDNDLKVVLEFCFDGWGHSVAPPAQQSQPAVGKFR